MPKLPVIVFIHGGDFIGGSSQIYNGLGPLGITFYPMIHFIIEYSKVF
jgi:acetyl esterase/lipase